MPPQFANTPEALLGRNDSRNPSTTCRGITSAGRPCRRALASPKASPTTSKRHPGGAGLTDQDGGGTEADLYCWQHKSQAQDITVEQHGGAKGKEQRDPQLYPLQERSSIDTLVQRLGIASSDVSSKKPPRKKRRPEPDTRPPPKERTDDNVPQPNRRHQPTRPDRASKPLPKKKNGFLTSLCCMTSSQDDDYVEVIRHRRRVNDQRRPEMAPTPNATPPWRRGPNEPQQPTDDRRQSKRASAPANIILPIRDHSTPTRLGSSQSQSTQLLSLIPSHLSPQTTSALLAELVKPISPTDEEGYIYIFWLTPQTQQAPPESTARSLLSPPTRPDHDRRISDVMTEYSFHTSPRETAGPKNPEPKTIMLKIGRANNITRRMNEWQRQCGYALNLIRWYPHVPSGTTPVTSPLPSPRRTPNRQSAQPSLYPDLSPLSPSSPRRASETSSGFVRKVQNVKRVERLIHLELAERQVKRVCGACGKEHREWFQVEASRKGVRGVDECVRRWVEWSEGLGE